MSSFTDRIRARTRRANVRQARSQGQQPQRARREVAQELALNADQVAAIHKALGAKPIDDAMLQVLVLEGKLTWAEITAMSPRELGELADAIERYKHRTAPAVAPPGNAPGEYPGQAEQGTAAHMAPEQLDDSTPREPQHDEPAPLPAAPATSATVDATRVEFPKSSNIHAAEVDGSGVLTVQFQNGQRYRYGNFTLELLREWSEAKSAGGWFNKNVRSKSDRHPVLEG